MSQRGPMLYQTIIVVDVANFTDPARTVMHYRAVREGLYDVLRGAFVEAGVDLDACVVEDRGDGALILVPPEVAKSQLADQLPSRLVAGLRRHNAVHAAEAEVQLRVVLHAGEVYQDEHGAVGQAVNFAFRILQAPEVKSALKVSTGVLALLASDTFYRDVIMQDPAADPDSYRRITVSVKEISTVAWLRLPDRAAPAGVFDWLPAAELQRLREWLDGITVSYLPMLVHRAAGPDVPPAPSGASAWEAFSYLMNFNAGADGFPPALMFVELLAREVGDEVSANLMRWNTDQARRLRLEPELWARRAAGEGGTWEIRTRGYGDHPAAVDLLHRDAVTGALADLLGPPPIQLDSDRLTGDRAGPTVVALDGPWGSGKTTLVGLVEKELGQISRPHLVGKKPSRLRVYEADRALSRGEVKLWQPDMMAQADPDANDPPVITTRFEPWAHQTGEQIWAGLTSTLLNAVGRILLPEGDFATERYWFQRNVARLDRVQLRRTLRKRVLSPFLGAAVLALVVPIVAQMARSTDQYQLVSLKIAGSNIAVLITAIALAIAVIHTIWRYYRLPAADLLPTELFVGPVASSIFSTGPTAADGAVRDPYYHARSGYLYLSQHDVFAVLEDVQQHGFHLIVFIDDLDRCTPRTTAEVFEAINIFVTRTFPVTRFVLCIDSCAVVAHLDEAYTALKENEALRVGSDPTPGWSFLRKLIQLPIPMPSMRQNNLDEVLEGLLGPVVLVAVSDTDGEARNGIESERDSVSDSGVEDPAPTRLISTGTATESDEVAVSMTGAEVAAVVATLENDPDVRERIMERLEALPQLSTRETKRLLTIWQYYVRVVTRLAPITGKPATERARHLVILAEIISRWPASQRCLHARVGGNHGLVVLAHAVNDDRAWRRAINQLGLTTDTHRECCKALRVLLREYEGVAVADLATQVA